MKKDYIINEINKIKKDLIDTRRKIHENPELSMEEYQTTDLIIEKLREYGLEDIRKIKDTGVVANIYGNSEKCIAIRADIDALPIEEDTELSYKSKISGKMHACGHDIHTICLLGTANILNKMKEDLPGIVKLIFQPGEEVSKGAKYMIENGALEDPKPLGIFGLHTWPSTQAGKIIHRAGKMSASSDTFEIIIKGKQGHGAHPETAVDPVYISGVIITTAQSIISRELSPFQTAVITFATMEAGKVSNVIPSEAKLRGTIRALDEETRSYIHKRFTILCQDIAKGLRAEAEVKIKRGNGPVYNDEFISKVIEEGAKEILGEENYSYNPEPSMGSEDFSFYLDHIPGAMYRLGTGYSDIDNPPLHSNKFEVEETCIEVGVKVNVAVALKLLKKI